MIFKVLSILALVALVFSVTATADPVDEHAVEMEMLKMRAVEMDSRIQQVKAMEDNLRKRHEELDQHTHQLQAEHQKKLQELEALHEDKIKALAGKEREFVEKDEHVKKTASVKKTEKEVEPEEDDHVHA
ncbi:hypothetical protein DAPPUDRAFT_320622 [Daphnia pulex]|uniref:Uncharacterized protein n=1 Tax=Daphnia pulex TaxID=6669 RepID=E9GQN3_DAPPU|nr:hypothetical protein DAPPUDRAFT_320622 [Daphnia pulex]|eukprot:EFX78143.1 hypothetical protein DAPPUDRAFT_320622 [Daphnia pulex]